MCQIDLNIRDVLMLIFFATLHHVYTASLQHAANLSKILVNSIRLLLLLMCSASTILLQRYVDINVYNWSHFSSVAIIYGAWLATGC